MESREDLKHKFWQHQVRHIQGCSTGCLLAARQALLVCLSKAGMYR